MTRHDKIRMITYIVCGVFVLGLWAGFNYTNYLDNEYRIQQTIEEEIQPIIEEREMIESEQRELRQVQRVFVEPPAPTMSLEAPSDFGGAPSAELSPEPTDPIVDELQNRIDELEGEKERLAEQKGIIANEIRSIMSIFSVGAGNPMINIVILPLIAYAGKKFIDILFKYLNNKVFSKADA